MRAIAEYKIKGTFDDEPVNLSLTAYRDNIKKSKDKGLRASVLRGFNLPKNITIMFKKNSELHKKVVAGALTLMIATSFAGCKMEPKAEVLSPTQIEEVEELEQKGAITYTIKFGDTLEDIAFRYTSRITSEVAKICQDNKISNANTINAGQTIKLDVPISKLELFGYTFTIGEVSEIEAKTYFVEKAFAIPASEVYSGNISFWRDQQRVVGLKEENPHNLERSHELPLLYKAHKAIEELEIMQNSQTGFYSEEDIKIKEAAIYNNLKDSISIAETATGKKYGEDYILEPPIEVVPLEPAKTK